MQTALDPADSCWRAADPIGNGGEAEPLVLAPFGKLHGAHITPGAMMAQGVFAPGAIDGVARCVKIAAMPGKPRGPDKHPGHFIQQWRLFRAPMSQERLAQRVGFSTATISRIENGKQPYNQEMLELLADALNCEPADLLRPPPDPARLQAIDLLERIPPDKRDDALRILRALAA